MAEHDYNFNLVEDFNRMKGLANTGAQWSAPWMNPGTPAPANPVAPLNGMNFDMSQYGVLGGGDPNAGTKTPWYQDTMFANDQGGFNWGGVAAGAGAAKGLADSWLALQQLDLAKEQFGFQKGAFTQQFNNQAGLANTELADRQARRVSASGAGPDGYRSVGDYMAQNRVKEFTS